MPNDEDFNVAQEITANIPLPSTRVSAGPSLDTANFSPDFWIDQYIESEHEAGLLLHTFQLELSPFFPFVAVPDQNFSLLRREKPYVVLTVLMISCQHDRKRQHAIAKKMREILSYNILVKGEQCIDLLQSLLLYLGW